MLPTIASPVTNQVALAQRLNDTIFVDRRLNAIILTGSAEENKRAKELIETVDVPLPVILVQSEVVELTERAAKDLGIAFGSNGALATGRLQSQSLQVGQGDTSLQASIYAQVQQGQGRIVTRPSVIAQSGTFASILTGDSIPISTTITYPGPTPVIQQQIQYISVGVSLQIQPRLTSDNMVLCHILSQVSTVTQYVQGYPQISQRTATTTATVQSGQPLVIGGLVQENEISNLEKIPVLGDLPLIGSLFRVRHESRQRTNLYIITTMTPVDTNAGTARGTGSAP
jgi:general secretion pathway protein D